MPTMSAPARASASAIASPMPRRQPVTSATLPERSNITARRRAVDEHLHRLARVHRPERLRHPVERHDVRDQRARSGSLRREQTHSFLVVDPLVDARTDQRQLAPEDAEQIDRAEAPRGSRPRRRVHERPGSRSPSRCRPGRAGDLEGDLCACALVHSSTQAACRRSAGSTATRPSDSTICGAGRSARRPRPPLRPIVRRSRSTGRSVLLRRRQLLARRKPGAPYVVHGDRGRFGQRRGLQRQATGQPNEHVAGTFQRDCIDPGASIPRKTSW